MRVEETPDRKRGFCLLAAAIGALCLLLPRTASGDACVWTGASSTAWTNAGNWSSCPTAPNYPSGNDTATINSAANQPVVGVADSITVSTVTINSGASVTVAGTLTLSNAATGAGSLTVSSGGTLNWNAGVMGGIGSTTISSGASLNLVTGGVTLQRPLVNQGTATEGGGGYLSISGGGSLSNSGTWEIQNDLGIYGSSGVVTNSGTIKRTTSSGIANIQSVLNSTGSVLVQSGTLLLTGGGASGGAFTFTGNTLRFNGGTWTLTGAFSGGSGGTLLLDGGTQNFNAGATLSSVSNLTVAGATANFNTGTTITPANLTLSSGTLAGSDAVALGAGGTMTWTFGTMAGSGTTTIGSGRTLLLNQDATLQRPLVNQGTATVSGGGRLTLSTGGSLTNSGTFEIQNDEGVFGSSLSVTNTGTIRRSTSSGLAYFQPVLNGSGAVQVQSGTLLLTGGGNCSGNFTFTGGTLQFNGGTWTLTGAFSGPSGGNLLLDSGTLNFNAGATFSSVSTLTLAGATVNFNTGTTVAPANLTLSSGTLSGADAIALGAGGTLTWTGGTMAGAGTTTIGSGRTLLVNGGATLQRPLVNQGTAIAGGSGVLSITTGGSLNNSGTWEIRNDNGIGNASAVVTNSGTIRRTTSSGTALIQPVLNGSGAVQVESGTLRLTGGGNYSGNFTFTGNTLRFNGGTWTLTGTFTGGSGGTLLLDSGTQNFNAGATLPSVSTLKVAGGIANFNTGTTVTPANLLLSAGTLNGADAIALGTGGTMTWTDGTMAGSGTTTIGSGRNLLINGSVTLQRPLAHQGTATTSGSGYLSITTGGSLNNSGTWEIQNDQGIYGSSSVVSNSGTIARTTSSGTAFIQSGVSNSGTVNVQSGTLAFTSGVFTQTAGGLHLVGGNLSNSQPLNIQGGVLDGSGTINGNVSVSGSGQFSPGASPGEISIIGNHTYTQANPGVLAIDVNGVNPGTDFDRVLISGGASLGGELKVTLGYTPSPGDSFTILTHKSRTGTFGKLTLPSPGAGAGWSIDYASTFTTLSVAQISAGTPLSVDARAGSGTVSDANGVLEPGERVVVEPTWENVNESVIADINGTASNFTGPDGSTYTLNDASAKYGTINANSTANCFSAMGDCYQVQVSDPATRPAGHWDTTFQETVTGGIAKTWTLHVGESFADVPRSQPFYQKIETLLHNGITAGCTLTQYCPTQNVSRGQMAIFVAKGIAGGGPNIPNSGDIGGKAYNCIGGGTSLFADVLPTDIYCKHVHYIALQNVTAGCSATEYCPAGTISRLEMAAFIAKAIVAPAGGSAVPSSYGPDPVTGFSYNCNGSNIHFTDVPASNVFCKHVHYLWAKGIISGISATLYGPNLPVTRDAMAKFLSNAFNLRLYGP